MEDQRGISQTIVQGFQAPAVFTGFIVINAFFLGMVLVCCMWLLQDIRGLKTEVRLMQEDVQNQNGILLRSGLKTPDDLIHGPVTPLPQQRDR